MNDGHVDYASTSEQTISAFTELSFTDDFSETGSSVKENCAPTPPYVDPYSINSGVLKEQLMDVVGLTLGLMLDDTKRYPLQDLPVPVRPPPRITEGMCVELKRFPFILLTDRVVFPEIQTRAQARAFVISPLVQIKLSYLLLP
jgi:hypothetical protein